MLGPAAGYVSLARSFDAGRAESHVAYFADPVYSYSLKQGIHDGSTLTCMEHMWQFDLKTGGPLGDAQEGLKEYRLKEEHGDLYIALEG